MRTIFQRRARQNGGKMAFSLVEVIIAIGILGVSVLAIVAFLGSITQSTTTVMTTSIASRIANNIQAELDQTDIDQLYSLLDNPSTDKIVLVATEDGERVRVREPASIENVTNHHITGTPPGIPDGNRYFEITVRLLENSFDVNPISESVMLPVAVEVVWPHQIKRGPADPNNNGEAPYVDAKPEQQSRYTFNTVILRKQ